LPVIRYACFVPVMQKIQKQPEFYVEPGKQSTTMKVHWKNEKTSIELLLLRFSVVPPACKLDTS
jgi:hypothetical protein